MNAGALDAASTDVLLALADDELFLGHWYATWIGLGPFLEEDLAFTSIGQDEVGHARALYSLILGGVVGEGDTPDLHLDALALRRPPEAYRCAALVEDPCPSWAETFVRHVLYDEAEAVRWEAFLGSTLPGLDDLARHALAEEAFHTRHAHSLFVRLARGGDAARAHLGPALERLLPLAEGLFEPTAGEADALAAGVLIRSSAEQASVWRERLDALAAEAGLTFPWPAGGSVGGRAGGRRGVRSAGFAPAFAEMTAVFALDPTARW